ncbi:Vmc-like lipoprotein signal peptide domain-containing protein [Aliifodinibius sp. S!AR15-10]
MYFLAAITAVVTSCKKKRCR